MPINPFFGQGTQNESGLLEDLIIEAIQAKGQEFYYIPRVLVDKDTVFNEDRLSQYKNAYPIEMYMETPEGFAGASSFMTKFGHLIDQSSKLTVARRRWLQLIGNSGNAQLPERPAEGDLLYFPLTGSIFVIKYVEHQHQFYQLTKLYTWSLSVELFTYSSERIDTGIPEIDFFETSNSLVTNAPEIPANYGKNDPLEQEYIPIGFPTNNPFGEPQT
jgi:hypothetical protein